MSMTPAFSPGPWITHDARVGSVRRCIFEDLYEQCSFHIAEKMPSSVKVGLRPIRVRMRAYSCGVRPCATASATLTRRGSSAFVSFRADPALALSFSRDAALRCAVLLRAARAFAAVREGLGILAMRPNAIGVPEHASKARAPSRPTAAQNRR